MLGHLRMNVEEAIKALVSIGFAVFPPEMQGTPDYRRMTVPQIIKALASSAFVLFSNQDQDGRDPGERTKALREAVEGLLRSQQLPFDIRMIDQRSPSVNCKVCVAPVLHRLLLTRFQSSLRRDPE
jgi:hypothetical protein